MAWEMQRWAHELIEPSILEQAQGCDDPQEELTLYYTEQRFDHSEEAEAYVDQRATLRKEAEEMSDDQLIKLIAEHAKEVACTTNGAWEFYLLREGIAVRWSVPFCSEEVAREYWA